MRDILIDVKLVFYPGVRRSISPTAFGFNQDQPDFIRLGAQQEGIDHRMDACRPFLFLAARDQQVGQPRQIRHNRLAGSVPAQRKRRQGILLLHLRALQHAAQRDRFFAFSVFEDLDAYCRLSGRRLEAHAVRRQTIPDRVLQFHDAVHWHARPWLQLIARDRRTMRHARQLSLHAEVRQHAAQAFFILLELFFEFQILRRGAHRIEQLVHWRTDVICFLLFHALQLLHICLNSSSIRATSSLL